MADLYEVRYGTVSSKASLFYDNILLFLSLSTEPCCFDGMLQ